MVLNETHSVPVLKNAQHNYSENCCFQQACLQRVGVKNRLLKGSSVDYGLQVLDRPPPSAPGLPHEFRLAVLQALCPETWNPVTGFKPGGASLLRVLVRSGERI